MTPVTSFNASFYIKMGNFYPDTTPSQAIIIIDVPTKIYEKELSIKKLDHFKENVTSVTGSFMVMDQGDASSPVFIALAIFSGKNNHL